jgi:hypothetical protein
VSGTWIIAWSDTRNDIYARTRTDVFVTRSTDDGLTWLPDERADTDVAGAAESFISGLVPTGGDDFFVTWVDRRNASGRAQDLYANRYAAGTGGFGLDYRIDTDARQATAVTLRDPVVVTDGVSGVYVAFSARNSGHELDIFVARSTDGGYTFDVPVRVGSTPAGDRVELSPYMAATPDGNVYVAFVSDDPVSGLRELRFNHSSDFGATWQPGDTVLGSWGHPVGYFISSFNFPNIQLRAVNGGTAYVAWSDNVNIFLARSFNGGQTFDIADVDQDNRGFNLYPALCAQGDQVVLLTMTPDETFNDFSVWGTVSNDRGDNWSALTQLRSESTPERGIFPVVACSGGDQAVAVWIDLRSGITWELFANRWDGTTWLGDTKVSGPAGESHFWPSVSYAGPGVVVAAYQNFSGSVYVARSSDAGATFPVHQRLDDAAPDPDMSSDTPRAVSDGDDIWVFWLERSAGDQSIAVRASSDSGQSYGPVRRLNRELPQGAFRNSYFIINARAAALPDAGFLAWGGTRDDLFSDILINAFDLDDADRDGLGAGVDCDNADPAVRTVPGEVSGLAVVNTGVTRLSWDSQDSSAGTSTIYDIVTGQLSELRGSGAFDLAACLAVGVDDVPFDDSRADPATGEAYYYLVRGRNACGTGSYGDSTLAVDPRDLLDTSGPCP